MALYYDNLKNNFVYVDHNRLNKFIINQNGEVIIKKKVNVRKKVNLITAERVHPKEHFNPPQYEKI